MTIVRVNDGTRTLGSNTDSAVQSGTIQYDGHVMQHGPIKSITLWKPDLAASEAFNLIDLSDITNFQHTETGKIRLYTLDIIAETQVQTAGEWILYVGVIVEVDADNGTAEWIAVIPWETYLEATDDTDRRHYKFAWPNGLDLEVAGATDTLANHLTNASLAGDTLFQTAGADLDSPAGDTSSPCGDGDVILYCLEATNGSTLSICVTATYITEAL